MRTPIPVFLLAAFACSAVPSPEPTPPPRPDPSVASPPPADADRAARSPAPVESVRARPWRGAVTYRCAGDRTIETSYADDGTVAVRWNGRWYTLRPEQAASGALFVNSSLRWQTEGNSASLGERGRTVASGCSVQPGR